MTVAEVAGSESSVAITIMLSGCWTLLGEKKKKSRDPNPQRVKCSRVFW